ncbi:MAG TPA: choice-of-anchor P family protein [Bryobacteraceae bacterium]|nr:choice-of-anchor P family protein [Bryobacteraceae bacterium]
MFRQPGRRFLYKALAVGASGSFTKPHVEHLEAQASCALPIHGGRASARVDNFQHRNIISFRSAQTHASGSHDPETESWNTLVTATVEGLNIQHVVTCDRIVARLASHHFEDGREPSIITLGSHFDNLKVAGQPVTYDPDSRVMKEWDTFSKAKNGCPDLRPYANDGHRIHSSIVQNVQCVGGVDIEDNAILFTELGKIFLGEIIIYDGERHLTMMRVEFGCETDGSGNFGDVGGNGSPSPP